jgi:hypothetical protein
MVSVKGKPKSKPARKGYCSQSEESGVFSRKVVAMPGALLFLSQQLIKVSVFYIKELHHYSIVASPAHILSPFIFQATPD